MDWRGNVDCEPSWTLALAVESAKLARRCQCCVGERRKRQDPRIESLLRSIATHLFNSRGVSSTCAGHDSNTPGEARGDPVPSLLSPQCLFSADTLTAIFALRRENVEQVPHRFEHPRHCTVCLVLCNRSCVECHDRMYHDCSHESLCAKCVLKVDSRKQHCMQLRQHHPGPTCLHDSAQTESLGNRAATDLFVLAHYAGIQWNFIRILDPASTFGVVAMVPSKHPKVVWGRFFQTLDHCLWRAVKVASRPGRRIRARLPGGGVPGHLPNSDLRTMRPPYEPDTT